MTALTTSQFRLDFASVEAWGHLVSALKTEIEEKYEIEWKIPLPQAKVCEDGSLYVYILFQKGIDHEGEKEFGVYVAPNRWEHYPPPDT